MNRHFSDSVFRLVVLTIQVESKIIVISTHKLYVTYLQNSIILSFDLAY